MPIKPNPLLKSMIEPGSFNYTPHKIKPNILYLRDTSFGVDKGAI
jgi:hypothetical protein